MGVLWMCFMLVRERGLPCRHARFISGGVSLMFNCAPTENGIPSSVNYLDFLVEKSQGIHSTQTLLHASYSP